MPLYLTKFLLNHSAWSVSLLGLKLFFIIVLLALVLQTYTLVFNLLKSSYGILGPLKQWGSCIPPVSSLNSLDAAWNGVSPGLIPPPGTTQYPLISWTNNISSPFCSW